MRGHDLIRAERFRQESSERYTQEKDIGRRDELVMAAVSYLLVTDPAYNDGDYASAFWPWANEYWKPKDTKRNLIRAGALIAAAIDAEQNGEKYE
jgi:hypothetical protein